MSPNAVVFVSRRASRRAGASELKPGLWGASMATLIGLLAASGLRPGEALALDRSDVDLAAGTVEILNTKFGKSRRLPLHASSTEALASYAGLRDAQLVAPRSGAFLVNPAGDRLEPSQVRRAFIGLLIQVGITAPVGHRRPRLYDLRHGFAVSSLTDWHAQGRDVRRALPMLSAYMGHEAPTSTYWYLEAAPALMAAVADRLEASWGAGR